MNSYLYVSDNSLADTLKEARNAAALLAGIALYVKGGPAGEKLSEMIVKKVEGNQDHAKAFKIEGRATNQSSTHLMILKGVMDAKEGGLYKNVICDFPDNSNTRLAEGGFFYVSDVMKSEDKVIGSTQVPNHRFYFMFERVEAYASDDVRIAEEARIAQQAIQVRNHRLLLAAMTQPERYTIIEALKDINVKLHLTWLYELSNEEISEYLGYTVSINRSLY